MSKIFVGVAAFGVACGLLFNSGAGVHSPSDPPAVVTVPMAAAPVR